MRVVHYLNQFFGGLDGEEHSGAAPQTQDAAVGPGRLLEQVLGEDAQVVRTIVCGDNYAAFMPTPGCGRRPRTTGGMLIGDPTRQRRTGASAI